MSAVPTTPAEPLARPLLRAVPVRLVLAAVVLASTVAEVLLAHGRETPSTAAEYVSSALARSLAHGRLSVHGVSAHATALLVPLLTAPVWLVHDVAAAYRLVQLENALAMSLAAVPAYLLARRFGARDPVALGVSVLTVASPPLFYVPLLQAQPFAYPLVLALALAIVVAADRPSSRTVGLALVLAALVFATLADAPAWYRNLSPHANFSIAGADVWVVLLATGVAIAPAALVGLALALVRPRSRGELAFGIVAVCAAAGFLLRALLWGDTQLVQEGDLICLVPLLALGFALRVSRTPRRALPEVGVAAVLAAVASLVQLTGHAIDSLSQAAPVLAAFARLLLALRSPSGTATVFALGATALAVAGIAATRRRGELPALVVSIGAAVALLLAGSSYANDVNAAARGGYLPADAAWVDHAAGGEASLLVAPGASRSTALATLFWNPSLTRVLLLPGATAPDGLADPRERIAADSPLPVTGPVLVDGAATTVAFSGATRVAHWHAETLWRPHGRARLSAIVAGRLADGQLLSRGNISVWAPAGRLAGWVELRLTTPRQLLSSYIEVEGVHHAVRGGRSLLVRVAACGAGPWRSTFTAGPGAFLHGRMWTPVASVPRYVPDARACR